MKKILRDLKKASILGLVLSIISLVILVIEKWARLYYISSNLVLIGTIIYFISVLIKIKSNKNIIKIANIILIITFIVSTIFAFKKMITDVSYSYILNSASLTGRLKIFIVITDVIYWLVSSIYLINLFFEKISLSENFIKKAFICTSIIRIASYMIACIFYAVFFLGNYIHYISDLLFTIAIVTYFCQYKNERLDNYQVDENNNLSVLEILEFVAIVLLIIGVIFWREVVYSPKENIENKIESLSNISESFNYKYTTEKMGYLEFKLADSLEVLDEMSPHPDIKKYIQRKNETSGCIFIACTKR